MTEVDFGARKESKTEKTATQSIDDMEGGFLDRLYAESKKDKTFNHLMEIIESEENTACIQNDKEEYGSDTSGGIKATIADLERGLTETIQ